MKLAQLTDFGVPWDVVECIEAEEPDAPGPGQVLIEMLACPINPAELLIIEGKYASKPPCPPAWVSRGPTGQRRWPAKRRNAWPTAWPTARRS